MHPTAAVDGLASGRQLVDGAAGLDHIGQEFYTPKGRSPVPNCLFFLTLFKPGDGGVKPMFKKFCCKFSILLGAIWRYNLQYNPQHKCSKKRGGGGSKAV